MASYFLATMVCFNMSYTVGAPLQCELSTSANALAHARSNVPGDNERIREEYFLLYISDIFSKLHIF